MNKSPEKEDCYFSLLFLFPISIIGGFILALLIIFILSEYFIPDICYLKDIFRVISLYGLFILLIWFIIKIFSSPDDCKLANNKGQKIKRNQINNGL